jgi:hypothetical protein
MTSSARLTRLVYFNFFIRTVDECTAKYESSILLVSTQYNPPTRLNINGIYESSLNDSIYSSASLSYSMSAPLSFSAE